MRYFITLVCYGAHLHGDGSNSVDRNHNQLGGPFVDPNSVRVTTERKLMLQAPYLLNKVRRAVVLAAIQKHCEFRGWNLLAAHVRSNHVHVILESEIPPEKIMNEFKSYASRELNKHGLDGPDRRRWARHGSTRWLWKDEDVWQAIQYVIEEQGDPMAVFVAEEHLKPASVRFLAVAVR